MSRAVLRFGRRDATQRPLRLADRGLKPPGYLHNTATRCKTHHGQESFVPHPSGSERRKGFRRGDCANRFEGMPTRSTPQDTDLGNAGTSVLGYRPRVSRCCHHRAKGRDRRVGAQPSGCRSVREEGSVRSCGCRCSVPRLCSLKAALLYHGGSAEKRPNRLRSLGR